MNKNYLLAAFILLASTTSTFAAKRIVSERICGDRDKMESLKGPYLVKAEDTENLIRELNREDSSAQMTIDSEAREKFAVRALFNAGHRSKRLLGNYGVVVSSAFEKDPGTNVYCVMLTSNTLAEYVEKGIIDIHKVNELSRLESELLGR